MLLYFSDTDFLLLLEVKFDVTSTGRIRPSFYLKTQCILQDSDSFGLWTGLNAALIILNLLRITSIGRALMLHRSFFQAHYIQKCDLVHSFCFILFSGLSLYRRKHAESVLKHVSSLLEAYYSVTDPNCRDQVQNTLNTYFAVLDSIMAEVNEEEIIKLVAYCLISSAFLRIIFYMSAHPRISVISGTIWYAADNMFHFFIVFCFLFSVLGWLACWSFGPEKAEFSTVGHAIWLAFQMLVGEFPFEDPWKETPIQKIWYISYTFIVFFLSINVLLAIIVEAYAEVKRRVVEVVVTEKSLPADIISLFKIAIARRINKWPRHQELVLHLHATRHFKMPLSTVELQGSSLLSFKDQLCKMSDEFLLFVCW